MKGSLVVYRLLDAKREISYQKVDTSMDVASQGPYLQRVSYRVVALVSANDLDHPIHQWPTLTISISYGSQKQVSF